MDHLLPEPVRQLGGAIVGWSVASVAATATTPPRFGPALIVVLGYDLPLLPALLGAIGVVATRRFAPVAAVEARMDPMGRHALTAMMVLAMLALVLSGERRPLVIVGIAGGLGYSGVALFELLAAGVVRLVRAAIEIFSRGAISFVKDQQPKDGE